LSRADIARGPALDRIDRHYSRLVAEEIGPLGALHALKRAQAIAGGGPLLDGDAAAVLDRATAQDERLAGLDRARRAMKSAVRAATTSAEINEIVARLG